MNKPIRIQRKRIKGWRMPPNTVYVGRPTLWGNENKVVDGNYKLAVALYSAMLSMMKVKAPNFYKNYLKPLKGKNLACWCPLDKPCHADILLQIANSD